MYRKYFKRTMDIIFSMLILIIFSPFFIIISLIVLIFLGSPIFFIQERPGLNEKMFRMIKFRTMKNTYNEKNELLPDSIRITTLGKLFRKTSIDELPELINILKGEMSFVGPRPLLPEYLPYYKKEERIRHSVRPGLTGLAQVSGRNRLNWDERLYLDRVYVKDLTFIQDIKIVFKSILNIIIFKDVDVIPSETGKKLSIIRKNYDDFKRE